MATHGVVQARLILPDGKDMGPHLFFVQLRSLEDHSPMLGITIGDIGPKAHGGFTATDNGFARFHHVRIPKEHMLSKFAQVTDDGRYVQPPHAKLSYGGMLYIRSGMVTAAGWQTAKAATISIRYATVRRQGEREKGPQEIDSGLERQIITYPSVYTRLLPILSRAYVFIKLGKILTTLFATFQTQLSTNNLNASFLGELHALTSGLKVLCTTLGVNDIEQARRSMGGHGYSAFAGLGRVYADFLPSVTYEGDNFVLDQQVVRAALKAYKALFASFSHPHLSSHGYGPSQSRDSQLPPSSAYLRLLIPTQCPALIGAGGSSSASPLPPPLVQRGFRNTPVDWMDYQNVVLILEWRAAVLVQNHASSSASAGTTVDLDPSVNQRVSRAVTEAFVASKVGEMIEGLTAGSGGKGKYIQEFVFAEEDARVLKDLYLLYLLTTAEAALTDLLTFSLLSPPPNPSPTPLPFPSPSYTDPTIPLRTALSRLSHSLLPHLIRLTDSFGFTDWELDSALGVYDGRVYERLVERAAREPLNDGGERRGYEESIKPILERGQRQARELGEAMRAGKGGAKL
ncbi:hypothetical protein AX16_008153 [Volvariella volvacea WC 439]|nr:hypothetical protein AX16_008153 [Volvariella volvacea WC 439]